MIRVSLCKSRPVPVQLHTVATGEKMDSYFWERSASLPRDLLGRLSLTDLFEETGGGGGGHLRQDNEEVEGAPNLIPIWSLLDPNLIPVFFFLINLTQKRISTDLRNALNLRI